MDLTKEYPRSVRDKWQGVVQLGRTIDKGKAEAQGTVGDYHYNCPMDQAVFGFLGMDHERVLEAIRNAKTDAEIEEYTRPFVDAKSSVNSRSNAGTTNGSRTNRRVRRVKPS